MCVLQVYIIEVVQRLRRVGRWPYDWDVGPLFQLILSSSVLLRMDVWTPAFLEHQFAVLSILASSRRRVLFFLDLLHHSAEVGRIDVVE